MKEDADLKNIRFEIGDSDNVDAVVLALRQDDQLHELVCLSPPVEAALEKIDR